MCVRADKFFGGKQFVQYDDGSYGCKNGYYLNLYWTGSPFSLGGVQCLTVNGVRGMLQIDGTNIYTDELYCKRILGMVVYTGDKIRLCITI